MDSQNESTFLRISYTNPATLQKKQTGKAIRESRSTGFQYFRFDICGTHIGHLKCSFCSTTIPNCSKKLLCFRTDKLLLIFGKRLFFKNFWYLKLIFNVVIEGELEKNNKNLE
jgi:hypothetical protein